MNTEILNYKVLRPCLWFCKNDKVSKEQLTKYFNEEAFNELVRYGFIEEVKKELPKNWKELEKVKGHYVIENSSIGYANVLPTERNRNIFPTKEEAEACLALSQLCQLRDVYNGEPLANWCNCNASDQKKHNICIIKNKINCSSWYNSHGVLSFKTAELRDTFLQNFEELILIAQPLL